MKKIRRTTALILALVMLMSLLCSTAWAMEPIFVMPVPGTESTASEEIAGDDVDPEDVVAEDENISSEDVVSGDVAPSDDADADSVEATGSGQVVLTDTITATQEESQISLYAAASNGVAMADGTHVRFIDRINAPAYAKTLYNSLVEASDNDNTDDWLIDVTQGELRSGDYVVKVTTFDGTASTKAAAQTAIQNQFNTMSKYIRAVYDAFDRDHPEVFWLDGKTTTSVSYLYYSNGTYSATVYFKLKASGFDVRKSDYIKDTDANTAKAIRDAIAQRDKDTEKVLSTATGSDYAKVKAFNKWLTNNNGYNTSGSGKFPDSAFECVTALAGKYDKNGPVCEGYSRAFKVLCDKAQIPCVLVDGTATNSQGKPEDHMWNYVQIESKWYGVDVTWNDPITNGKDGLGNENYLLVGSGTTVGGLTFIKSHPVANQASSGGVQFTNGPALNSTAYTGTGSAATKKSIVGYTVTLSPTAYTYNGSAKQPTVTVRNGSVTLVNGTDYKVTYSNNTNAGTATVKIDGAGSNYTGTITKTFTINKATQTPAAQIAVSSITAGNTAAVDVKGGYGTLTYSSSDDSIATVNSSGVITGVKAGTVTITVNAAGNGNYNAASTSFDVTINAKSGSNLLNAPGLPTLSNTTSGIKIAWTKVTGAAKYRIFYKTGSGGWTKLADTASTSYTWTKPKSGTTYKFTICCLSSDGKSCTSNYDTTGASIKFLTALTPTLSNAASGATIKWTKVTGASGYYVYRKTTTGSYAKIKTITSGNTVSYTDTAVKSKNGTKYSYAVKAYSGSTAGAYTGKWLVRLTTPTISSVTNSASKKMTVKWKKDSTANGYQIQYGTSKTFSGAKTVKAAKPNIVSLNVSNLTKGKTYYVRMRTYKTVSGTTSYSDWTAAKSIKIAK